MTFTERRERALAKSAARRAASEAERVERQAWEHTALVAKFFDAEEQGWA